MKGQPLKGFGTWKYVVCIGHLCFAFMQTSVGAVAMSDKILLNWGQLIRYR